MGLIRAAMGAAGGTLADQWKEYFYCDAIPENVLAVKGQKKTARRSSNRHGDDNVITDGSVIAVADGQCMLIVDQGKIVDMCAETGEYTYDMSSEPSLFCGSLGQGLKNMFGTMANRFTFGGEAPKDQRIYYFNTKELIGNKYGTPSPVPFRVVDQRAGIDIDVGIRCFGEYSYRVSNPMLFYTNVCGNVSEAYTRDRLDSQLKTELLTALQPAFAKIGETGIRYSQLPGHTMELADALKGVKMLDAMTVYKDRRQYPHKLQSAIDAYGVTTQNTHRAVDDAKAALEVLDAMAREEDDLLRYVNLFGYNPKYGVSGPRISSITYLPQGRFTGEKLYHQKAPALL